MTSKQTNASSNIKFSRQSDFRRELRRRVNVYFKENQLDQRDQRAMFVKTATILTWLALSYTILVFAPVAIWVRILAAISLGFATAGVGFSIMHDAGHRAYSRHKRLNALLFLSLDMLGGSSYMWNVKHNIMHHSFANLDGHDDDIDVGFLGRLSPEQRRLGFHRFQHLYMWPLYGFLTTKWQFWDDFYCWAVGRVGNRAMVRPRGKDAATLVLGKLFWFSLAFIIPTLFHPLWGVILFYLLAACVQGVVMAVIFQLAHCVEEAQFPPVPEDLHMPVDWATHQVMTTVNFGRENRLLSWYIGGLNFQVEHHLFPGVCHTHYPAISEIVERTCADFSVPYRCQPTLRAGVRSHYRHLRALGQPQPAPLIPQAA